MKNKVVFLLFLIFFCQSHLFSEDYEDPILTMPIDELKANVEKAPPLLMFMLAGRLMKEGTIEDAAFYFYLAQNRYRYYRSVKGDEVTFGERTTTGAMSSVIGQSLNPMIAKSTSQWKAVVDRVLNYVEHNDYVYCSRVLDEGKYQEALAQLLEFSDYIRDNTEEIRRSRTENGLENFID